MFELFNVIFDVPSNATPEIVLAVASLVAVAAFPVIPPVRVPVTSPTMFAFNVPLVTDKSPVLEPVKLPVPIRN